MFTFTIWVLGVRMLTLGNINVCTKFNGSLSNHMHRPKIREAATSALEANPKWKRTPTDSVAFAIIDHWRGSECGLRYLVQHKSVYIAVSQSAANGGTQKCLVQSPKHDMKCIDYISIISLPTVSLWYSMATVSNRAPPPNNKPLSRWGVTTCTKPLVAWQLASVTEITLCHQC